MTIAKATLLLLFQLLALAHFTYAYPARCAEIGDSVLGTVTDCDVQHDPLPFHWTSTVKLKKNLKWAGVDDVSYIYSNPNQTVTSNCSLAAPLPATYQRNDNLTIEQVCTKFQPALMKGATLVIIFFYTHHDSFDDVLMYKFPIPGYINDKKTPYLLEGQEKEEMWRMIKTGVKLIKRLVDPLNLQLE